MVREGEKAIYLLLLIEKKLKLGGSINILGILLGQSGSVLTAKKYITEQGSKAMFSLLRKIKILNLPLDIQIELFNKIVKPVLLYGCEVLGYGNLDVIKRVQLRFFKYIFNLKNSTPSVMIYGEIGAVPLAVEIKSRRHFGLK